MPAGVEWRGATTRKITITFELDDEPWVDDEGYEFIHDVVDEAPGIITGAIDGGFIGLNRFVEATRKSSAV